ncbi:hypothetical protein E2542_SST24794 [Spatholobus suberectus]|nr:hypothetical protein E2542_SST24794 [Spatholobus suberectus]
MLTLWGHANVYSFGISISPSSTSQRCAERRRIGVSYPSTDLFSEGSSKFEQSKTKAHRIDVVSRRFPETHFKRTNRADLLKLLSFQAQVPRESIITV